MKNIKYPHVLIKHHFPKDWRWSTKMWLSDLTCFDSGVTLGCAIVFRALVALHANWDSMDRSPAWSSLLVKVQWYRLVRGLFKCQMMSQMHNLMMHLASSAGTQHCLIKQIQSCLLRTVIISHTVPSKCFWMGVCNFSLTLGKIFQYPCASLSPTQLYPLLGCQTLRQKVL